MCTSPDYAAMKEAAKEAIANAQQSQTITNAQQAYEDALIQRLHTDKRIVLTSTYFESSPQPTSQESGAYLTLSPTRLPDKADMISELTDEFAGVHEKTPEVAVKKALKLQTIDDHF